MNEKVEYEKPRKFRNRKKVRELPPLAEREHPVHQPYKRENHGNLRHSVLRDSLVVDGLGEDFDE